MLRRYGNLDIMQIDAATGIELIKKAYLEESKERAWQVYLTQYPYMTEESFITFEDYFKRLTAPPDTRTTEDILGEISELTDNIDWGLVDGDI